MWDGQTVAILASGPSMSSAVAAKCKHLRTIAINNTFQLAPWADMLYAADDKWWRLTEGWREFVGLKVTCDNVDPKRTGAWFKELLYLRHTGAEGFDPDPSCIKTGRNSGYQAIHIAAHAGAKRILLCGMDMRGGHWHGQHKSGLSNKSCFEQWIELFATLKPELDKRGVEVWNCTQGSALKCFPYMDLDEACALPDQAAVGVSA